MNDNEEIVIKVDSVYKQYFKFKNNGKKDPFYSLNNISFEVKRGEVLGIIGENGSGKSTLLRILSGITKPTKGSISYIGKVSSILDVGAGFHPDLTGRENVFLRGELLGMTKTEIENVFSKIVDFSELHDFIYTPVKHYSDGMFLRLAFSVIIFLKFDILLLDEVMTVGDASFRAKTEQKILELVKDNLKTVLIVSHNLHDLVNIATKFITLKKGAIIKQKTTYEAVKEYLKNSIKKSLEINTNIIFANINIKHKNTYYKYIYFKNKKNNTYFFSEKIIICSTFSFSSLEKKIPFLIQINNCFSNTIFATSYLAENEKLNIEELKTDYTFELELPSETLNYGVYYVSIFKLNKNNSFERIKNSILEFEIIKDKKTKNSLFENSPAILKTPLKRTFYKSIKNNKNEIY